MDWRNMLIFFWKEVFLCAQWFYYFQKSVGCFDEFHCFPGMNLSDNVSYGDVMKYSGDIQGVSGGIVTILGGGSMDYSE
jgi:hypothetical protein